MDLILDLCDKNVLTPYVYPSWLPEDDIRRQILSIFLITSLGGALLYLVTASLGYMFIFDKRHMLHPQYLKNQVRLEIQYTLKSIPGMSLLTSIAFLLEVRGYSKLYSGVDSWAGYLGLVVSAVTFLMFTDCLIYWIHRCLHHPMLYKRIHKPHHKWKVPTPFASHAFHPLDGFLQSTPYHIYPFIFPLHKVLYLLLFVFVNVWTVSIHDGDYRVPALLRPFINGSAHHTDHHLFYNYNYGQFFTLWDRIGGSFRHPSAFEGKSPLDLVKSMTCPNGNIHSSNGFSSRNIANHSHME